MRGLSHPVQLTRLLSAVRQRSRRSLRFLALSLPVTLVFLWSPAMSICAAAQPIQLVQATGQDKTTATQPVLPVEPPATIDGFRQAHFDMTEDQVRQAIKKDFPSALTKLKAGTHPSEKTTVLSLPVADLLPHTGIARVSYIFGYKSKRLIQVNIVWASEGNEESDAMIVGAANLLRDYFAGQKYQPDTVVMNRRLGEHMMQVFQGADPQGHTVVVWLDGAAAAARKDDKAPKPPPLTLQLSYIGDAQHPDVFKIGRGQF